MAAQRQWVRFPPRSDCRADRNALPARTVHVQPCFRQLGQIFGIRLLQRGAGGHKLSERFYCSLGLAHHLPGFAVDVHRLRKTHCCVLRRERAGNQPLAMLPPRLCSSSKHVTSAHQVQPVHGTRPAASSMSPHEHESNAGSCDSLSTSCASRDPGVKSHQQEANIWWLSLQVNAWELCFHARGVAGKECVCPDPSRFRRVGIRTARSFRVPSTEAKTKHLNLRSRLRPGI